MPLLNQEFYTKIINSREVTDSESQSFKLQVFLFPISLRNDIPGSLKGFNFASIQGICGEFKE